MTKNKSHSLPSLGMNSKDFGYNSRTCQHPIFPPEYTPVGCSCNTLGISCLNMNCSEPTCSFSTAVSRDWNSSSKYMYHKWKKTKHPCNIDHPYEYTDIVLVPQWYTCQLFPSHRCKIFILGVPRFLKTTQTYPKMSEDFRGYSKDIWSHQEHCSHPSPKMCFPQNNAIVRVLSP